MRRLVLSLTLVMAGLVSVGFGQEQPKPPAAKNGVPMMLQESTIKTMIDLVSRSVSRRYDLRPDQADAARQMLEKNTMEFVNKHYNDLLTVIPKMQDMRMRVMAGNDPSPAEVKELAQKIIPVYKDATQLIVSENTKFHDLLDDKQKVKHQQDMDKMKKDVAETVEKLDRWKKGDYKSGEFLGNQPNRKRKTPTAPPVEELMGPTSFSFWEQYVKLFIESFQLDSGQIPMAYTILNDMKTRAKAYRADHTREFAEARENIARLTRMETTQPAKNKELQEWKKKLEKLDKPLLEMFDELKERLMAVPTDDQRKAAQEVLGGNEPKDKAAAPATQTAPAEKTEAPKK
jgi:hypothetical protein